MKSFFSFLAVISLAALFAASCQMPISGPAKNSGSGLHLNFIIAAAGSNGTSANQAKLLLPTAATIAVSLTSINDSRAVINKTAPINAGANLVTVNFGQIDLGDYTVKAQALDSAGIVQFQQTATLSLSTAAGSVTLNLVPVITSSANQLSSGQTVSGTLLGSSALSWSIPSGALVSGAWTVQMTPVTDVTLFAQDSDGALIPPSATTGSTTTVQVKNSATSFITLFNSGTASRSFTFVLNPSGVIVSVVKLAVLNYGPATAWNGTGSPTVYGNGSILSSVNLGAVTPYTLSGTHHWSNIAGSDDGTVLFATDGGYSAPGYIYRSTDGGSTWTQTSSPQAAYNGLACSSTGANVGATVYDGTQTFYYSTDSGTTWSPTTISGGQWWSRVACSADGTHWAIANGGDSAPNTSLWTGILVAPSSWTWTRTPLGYNNYSEDPGIFSISADGQKIFASAGYSTTNDFYYSSNFGATWTNVTPSSNFVSSSGVSDVLLSGDGSTVVILPNAGQPILKSSTAGLTTGSWSIAAGQLPANVYAHSGAVSLDGSRIAIDSWADANTAPATNINLGGVFLSTNGGSSFVQLTNFGQLQFTQIFMNKN